MSVWRRGFEAGDGGWLGLQRALRVLRNATFAVAVHGRCGGRDGRGGRGRTLGAGLGVF